MPSDRDLVREVERTAARFAARHIEPVADEVDHGEPAFPGEVFGHGLEAGFDRFVLPESVGGQEFGLEALCSLVGTLAQTCAGHAMVFGTHAAALRGLHDVLGDAEGMLEPVLSAGRPIAVASFGWMPLITFQGLCTDESCSGVIWASCKDSAFHSRLWAFNRPEPAAMLTSAMYRPVSRSIT